jgi:uncharacterized damage-inducible protein DinB
MSTALDAIRGVLASTVPRWQQLVDNVPPDLLERRPAAGAWSAAECLEHLLHVERVVFGKRLRDLLAGRPALVPYDPDAPRELEPERTPAERVAAWRAAREEHLRLLAPLTEADLQRSSDHPEYGTTTLAMILHTYAAHDLDHTIQAETALMQPFIPHTGHWRWEFAAKDTAAAAQVS